MQLCDSDHDEIVYDTTDCPVCEIKEKITDDLLSFAENETRLKDAVLEDVDFYKHVMANREDVERYLEATEGRTTSQMKEVHAAVHQLVRAVLANPLEAQRTLSQLEALIS